MRNLLEFLSKYNHWFVFLLLEIISAVLLFGYNSYQNSVWFSSANALAGNVYAVSAEVQSFFQLNEVNQALTAHNVALQRQVDELEERVMNLSNDSTQKIIDKAELFKGFQLISAKVITNSVDKRDNLITLDKGSADGIQPNMGVISGMGVVGIVYLVSEHYSVVLSLLNSQSNISCTIKGKGYLGYLHWNGGSAETAFLDDIPRHAKLRKYDQIITSGYSSIFPQGIVVGRVTNAYNSPDGLSYKLKVRLSTDFSRLRDVFVVNNAPMKERINLMRAAQDSIQNNER